MPLPRFQFLTQISIVFFRNTPKYCRLRFPHSALNYTGEKIFAYVFIVTKEQYRTEKSYQ